MGLSISDFDELTPEEFNQALTGYVKAQEKALDNSLWQTRFLSSIVATFSQKAKGVIEPKKFFLLPGEKRETAKKVAQRDPKNLEGAAKALFKKLKKSNDQDNGQLSAD